MLCSKTLFLFTVIALSAVDATPLIHRHNGIYTLRTLTKVNIGGDGGLTLAERDRARARTLLQAHSSGRHRNRSLAIFNGLYGYTAQVGIGDPPNYYTLLVDTGSSNTWVGASTSNPYTRTKTSVHTGDTFNLSYGGANVFGEEMFDTVTLSPALVIKSQSIGAAKTISGQNFIGIDGILGIGPTDITSGTVSNTSIVPTVTDNLYSQKTISKSVVGIYFVPSPARDNTGELTFGGYDKRAITGPMRYAPLTTVAPASRFWGVDQKITYGSQTIQSHATGIIDTGTTLILLATDAFHKYQKATGAVMDETVGLLAIDADQHARLDTLSFHMGDTTFKLTPNAQIWPRSLNTVIGGRANAIYLIVGDLGDIPALKVGSINGFPFLERYYTVYDSTHRRVGFAKTAYTDADIN